LFAYIANFSKRSQKVKILAPLLFQKLLQKYQKEKIKERKQEIIFYYFLSSVRGVLIPLSL
jgi:hypothetical protein